MWGLITEGTGAGDVLDIRGVRFYRMPMGQGGLLVGWRRQRGWKKLRKQGVRQAVMPTELAEEGSNWGIRPVEVYSLRRMLWPQLPCGGTTAVLRAERGETVVEEAAAILAQRFRYVQMEIGSGGRAVAEMLLHCYGLCVGGGGEPSLTVSFGGAPLSEREICLGEDCALWQEAAYEAPELPSGVVQSEQLLAALFRAGGLKKEEIRLKTLFPALDRRAETHYNAE